MMAETGLRTNALLSLRVSDLDLTHGTAIVRRGKGGKGRIVPFGPQTAAAPTVTCGCAAITNLLGQRLFGSGYCQRRLDTPVYGMPWCTGPSWRVSTVCIRTGCVTRRQPDGSLPVAPRVD